MLAFFGLLSILLYADQILCRSYLQFIVIWVNRQSQCSIRVRAAPWQKDSLTQTRRGKRWSLYMVQIRLEKGGRFRRLNTRKAKTRMNSILARLDEWLVYWHLSQLTAELQLQVSYINNTYRTLLNDSIFYSYKTSVTISIRW